MQPPNLQKRIIKMGKLTAVHRRSCYSILAAAFGQALRALLLNCDVLRSLWSKSKLICTQVDVSCSPFAHPTQINNASWVTSKRCYSKLLANETQHVFLDFFFFFLRLACICKETCEVVWPPNAILYASSTCNYVRVGLSRALHVILFSFIATECKILQMIVEPKEDKGSLLWKTVEQFYRFGVGSIAGGEF